MSQLDAKVFVTYEMGGTITGADGYTVAFRMDDSFASWWAITRWNLHYRHWRDLRANVRDLFTKVLRRKLWRRSF